VNKKMTDNHAEITLDKEQMRDIGHCWIDKKDHIKSSLTELRQDDPYYLVFPYETKWGGLVGNEEKKFLSSSYSSEYLLDLRNEEYIVEIKVKGEDSDKNTITKKEKFKIKPPVNRFTTTKDTEIGGLTTQISQLHHNISQKESEVSTLTSQIVKLEKTIAERDSTISQKKKDMEQLNRQKNDLKNQLDQANSQIERLRRNIDELHRENKILKHPKQERPRVE